MAIRDYYDNFSTLTASAPLAIGGTSLVVDDEGALVTPAAGHELYLTFEDVNGLVFEIVKVTAVTGTTLTIVRAQQGTSAAEWPANTVVECRLTATALNNIVEFDQGGDALGTNAINLQTSRSASTEVASGTSAIAIGDDTTASGTGAIAIGDTTTASGNNGVAIGTQTTAALGLRSIALGYSSAVEDGYSIGISGYWGVEDGRNITYGLSLGSTTKPLPFDYAECICTLPFLSNNAIWETIGDPDVANNMQHTTREVTFTSAPVQAGDREWAATTSYTHGDCVLPTTPNGYSYFCYCAFDSAAYTTTDTSGGSEPTWPTTVGDSVQDGASDIWWVCVDLDDLQVLLPDYARFTPTSVGVIARACVPGGSAVQPTVSFGINGALAKYKAAAALTLMTGTGASQFYDPINTESAKQFGGAVTGGSDIDITLQLVLKGYVVENYTA